jgi:transcriptional regulator with XRE-family HTH domain
MEVNPAALKAIRVRSGMSLVRLAASASEHTEKPVNPDHLSNIEAGRRNPSEALAVALAMALKVELPAILANPEVKA